MNSQPVNQPSSPHVAPPSNELAANADQLQSRVQWRRRLARWLAAAGLLALLASLPLTKWDHQLSRAARLGDVPGDLRKAVELSEAFAHGSGVTAILIAVLLAANPPRRDHWLAVTMTASSGIAANLLKALFTRARPYTYDEAQSQSNDVTGWQFLGSGSFWDATHKSFHRVIPPRPGAWPSG